MTVVNCYKRTATLGTCFLQSHHSRCCSSFVVLVIYHWVCLTIACTCLLTCLHKQSTIGSCALVVDWHCSWWPWTYVGSRSLNVTSRQCRCTDRLRCESTARRRRWDVRRVCEERAVPSGADMATSTSIHSSQTDACPASDQRDHDWWRQRQSSRLTLRSLAVNCKLRRSTTSTGPYIHTRTAPMLCWHGPTDASTTVTQAYNYMYTQQDALVSVKRKCTLRRSINELLN